MPGADNKGIYAEIIFMLKAKGIKKVIVIGDYWNTYFPFLQDAIENVQYFPSTQSYSAAHTVSAHVPPRPIGQPSWGISPQSLIAPPPPQPEIAGVRISVNSARRENRIWGEFHNTLFLMKSSCLLSVSGVTRDFVAFVRTRP